MRFFSAVVFPPLAFWLCGRPIRAAVAVVVFALALLTMRWGVGVLLQCGLILWAISTVGDEHARVESHGFVAAVHGPRPTTRL